MVVQKKPPFPRAAEVEDMMPHLQDASLPTKVGQGTGQRLDGLVNEHSTVGELVAASASSTARQVLKSDKSRKLPNASRNANAGNQFGVRNEQVSLYKGKGSAGASSLNTAGPFSCLCDN